ncbi:hypothetical protein T08_14761, partial [Trichinella sp. T8]
LLETCCKLQGSLEMADKQEMYPLQFHKRSFVIFTCYIYYCYISLAIRQMSKIKNPCLEHVALFENLSSCEVCEVF